MSKAELERKIHSGIYDALLSVEQGDLQRLGVGDLEELARLAETLSERLGRLLEYSSSAG